MITLAALLLAAAQPGDVSRTEETDLLEFSYAWPAAAARDPALDAILRERMEAARSAARQTAEEDRRSRPADAPFNAHHYDESWNVEGDAARLLSLSSTAGFYTGGAHGNMRYETLLWDSTAHRAVDAHALFGAGLASLTPRYCAGLDAEREIKRNAPVDRNDMFGDCPDIAEQEIAPADRDRNGRFDTLRVLLPPYAAGPYVEGDYVIDVALTEADLAAIGPEYRNLFEAPGPDFRPVDDEPEE